MMKPIEYKLRKKTWSVAPPGEPDIPAYRVLHQGDSWAAVLAASGPYLIKRWFRRKPVTIDARSPGGGWFQLATIRDGELHFDVMDVHHTPQPHKGEFLRVRNDLQAPSGKEYLQCLGCEVLALVPVSGSPVE